MGSGHPYYPIDPWTLEGVLFNCTAMGLRISKNRKNRVTGKLSNENYGKMTEKSNNPLQKQFSMGSTQDEGVS